MAEEETPTEGGEVSKGGGMKKMMIFGVAALVLVVVGIFAGPAVMNMISPPEDVAGDGEAVAEEKSSPPIYQTLHPPLVVNFKDEAGDSHFMQITMEVMSREQSVVNALRDNVAVVRNALILLYSGSVYEEVTTREGKEKMLEEGLEEIERVMVETTGEGGVEALYFTALVIQ
ncbi:MAG: flagellar basal body-associated FliL family protein [Gammaproteobacteria bacterium]|nr:flagellar basal body-associated FliL family protein [Gammaproteobacteria bacterium]